MLIRLFLMLLALAAHAGFALAEEPEEPEKVFVMTARVIDANTIEAKWTILKDYYMYREKFKFAIEPATAKLGTPKFSSGKFHDDENFGKVEVYYKEVRVLLPVEGVKAGDTVTLKTISQGCWDKGVCYPPMPHEAKIVMAATSSKPIASAPAPTPVPAIATAAVPVVSAAPAPRANDGGDETSKIAGLLKGASFWLALTTFFGFGLLLSFTPCVFPMVPILSGIIVNHGHAVTHMRAFVLSLAYVMGMALTYAAAGVAAGLSGTLLSAALQNAWVLGGFALVFVALAFSMFGFYELQLPSALQSRISETANKQGGSLAAIALMGSLSALIVGPCVAAPLAGALLYIAQTGNAWLGGWALFALALGMGAPLILVGVFSRSLLPKTGPWMSAVNRFFGVMLLGVALWLVSPVLPAWVSMLGWAALLIVPAIYMHALDPLPPHASGWQKLWKGVGVVFLIAGGAVLLGLLGGARDPLQPLSFLRGGAGAVAAETHAVKFERIKSVAELDARLKSAGKPVMLDFYADWCVSCKEMEKLTFADPKVTAKMQDFMLLQADVTANNEDDKALLKRFGLFGPPGIIFFDAKGAERPDLRIVGYQPPEQFLPTLERGSR
jgi:thiol:disulfide interchange protein DsbD